MPWPQDAYVGQKVVCINDEDYRTFITKGNIYEIEDIFFNSFGNGPFLSLVGVGVEWRRPHGEGGGFRPYRFRPVQTKSTESGMAILRKLQDPKHHKVLEGV